MLPLRLGKVFDMFSLQFGDNLSGIHVPPNQSNSKMFYDNSGISRMLIFLKLLLRPWKKKSNNGTICLVFVTFKGPSL